MNIWIINHMNQAKIANTAKLTFNIGKLYDSKQSKNSGALGLH